MKLFARAVALVTGDSRPMRGDVEKALAECKSHAKESTAHLERMAVTRPALLVSGSDADIEKHDADARRTALERERANALVTRLSEQLASIIEAEAETEKRRRRAELETRATAAEQALRTQYPKAVGTIIDLLRTIATTQRDIDAFRKDYPGESPITDPEHKARKPAPVADRVVSEREVWRWEYLNGNPLPDMYYLSVREPGRGRESPAITIEDIEAGSRCFSLDGPFECKGDAVRLVRKTRRELIRQDRGHVPDRLCSTITLPSLLPGDPSWKPERHFDVISVLDARSQAAEPKPRSVIEYLPVKTA